MRTNILALFLLSGCSSAINWMGEASTLAAVPLQCPEAEIVTEQTSGFTFDSVGCGKAIRQSCRDRTCTPIGEVESADRYTSLSERALTVRTQLDRRGADVVQGCGGGAPVTLKILIAADGTFQRIYAETNLAECLTRTVGRLAPGNAPLLFTHTFQ